MPDEPLELFSVPPIPENPALAQMLEQWKVAHQVWSDTYVGTGTSTTSTSTDTVTRGQWDFQHAENSDHALLIWD